MQNALAPNTIAGPDSATLHAIAIPSVEILFDTTPGIRDWHELDPRVVEPPIATTFSRVRCAVTVAYEPDGVLLDVLDLSLALGRLRMRDSIVSSAGIADTIARMLRGSIDTTITVNVQRVVSASGIVDDATVKL